ncbi:MAG: YdcF family protein [Flavobacteriales bacterium]|nr:YdcF family protein [Flavobacteriales bacterium]
MRRSLFLAVPPITSNRIPKKARCCSGCICFGNIDKEDILLEDKSLNTHQNALYSKPILTPQARRSSCSLLAAHMNRAVACFEKQALMQPIP